MSDTVTLALRRIATAEGASVTPFDTDTILAKKLYTALTGSISSRLTFVEVSRQIAQHLGASVGPYDGPVTLWRKILEARGGSSSRYTLVGILQGVESVGLSGGGSLDAPANLTATAQSSSEILFDWDTVEGADYYVFQSSTDGATWGAPVNVNEPTTQYSLEGLDAGTIHYGRVVAKSNAGKTSTYAYSAPEVTEEGSTPYITVITREAKPGDVVGIHGWNFGETPDVYIGIATGTSLTVDEEDTWQIPADHVISTSNEAIAFILPNGLKHGVYTVEVDNGSERSAQAVINKPEPWQLLDAPGGIIIPSQALRLTGAALSPAGGDCTVRFIENHLLLAEDAGNSSTGSWSDRSYPALGFDAREFKGALTPGTLSTYTINKAGLSGTYEVYAWWVAYAGNSATALYTITTSTGDVAVTKDQTKFDSQWVLLGEFTLDSNFKIVVSNANAEGSDDVLVDAFRLRRTDSSTGTDVTASPVATTVAQASGSATDSRNVVSFTAPAGLTPGVLYEIAVQNDLETYTGLHRSERVWAHCKAADGSNTLNCPAGWSDIYDFYGTTVNVKTDSNIASNAAGDGVTYDDVAIQQAIDYAEGLGGGVVYFPTGNYRIQNQLNFGHNVVLLGDGPSNSRIFMDSAILSGARMIKGTTKRNIGIEGLKIHLASGGADIPQIHPLTCRYFYLYDVEVLNEVNGSGTILCDQSSMINCSLRTYPPDLNGKNVLDASYMDDVTIQNNTIEWCDGRIFIPNITRLQCDGNAWIRTVESDGEDVGYGGPVLNGCVNVFFAGNEFSTTTYDASSLPITQNNDGETILNESIPRDGLGNPTSVTSITLTDTGQDWSALPIDESTGRQVAIIAGPGKGQVRRVASSSTNTLTLDAAWDVLPTTESVYAIQKLSERWLIWDNIFTNCPRGIWLYGSCLRDVVIEENELTDAEAIYLRADQRSSEDRFNAFFNIEIIRNALVNANGWVPSKIICQQVWVDAGGGTGSDYLKGNAFFGISIRANVVDCGDPNIITPGGYWSANEGFGIEVRPETALADPSVHQPGPQLIVFQDNEGTDGNYSANLTSFVSQAILWDHTDNEIPGLLTDANASTYLLDAIATNHDEASLDTVIGDDSELAAPSIPPALAAATVDADAQTYLDGLGVSLSTTAEAIWDDAFRWVKGEAPVNGNFDGLTPINIWSSILSWQCWRASANVGSGATVKAAKGADTTLFNSPTWDAAFNGTDQYGSCTYTQPTTALSVVYHGAYLGDPGGILPYMGWSTGDSNRKATNSDQPNIFRWQFDGLQAYCTGFTKWAWVAWDALSSADSRAKADGGSLLTQSGVATADAGNFSDFVTLMDGRQRTGDNYGAVTPKARLVLDRYLTEAEGDALGAFLEALYNAFVAAEA